MDFDFGNSEPVDLFVINAKKVTTVEGACELFRHMVGLGEKPCSCGCDCTCESHEECMEQRECNHEPDCDVFEYTDIYESAKAQRDRLRGYYASCSSFSENKEFLDMMEDSYPGLFEPDYEAPDDGNPLTR